jgi:hypothetical protein
LANSTKKQIAFGQFRANIALGSTYYKQITPKLYAFYQGEYTFMPRNTELTYAKTKESYPQNKNTHQLSLNTTLVREIWDERLYVMGGLAYQFTLEPTRDTPLNRESNLVFSSLGLYFRAGEHFALTFNSLIPFVLDTGTSDAVIPRNSFSGFSLGGRIIF